MLKILPPPVLVNLETSTQTFVIKNGFGVWGNNYSYQNVQSIGLANSTINTGSGDDSIDISTTAAASTFSNSWNWGVWNNNSNVNVESVGLFNSPLNTGSGDDAININSLAKMNLYPLTVKF